MPLPGTQILPAGISLRSLFAPEVMPRLCAAVNETAAPSLVLLRETADALVYAGALADSGNRVLQWVEIWVQRVATSAFFSPGKTAPTRTESDARWHDLRKSFSETEPGRTIITGRENEPSPPCVWGPDGKLLPTGGEKPPAAALVLNPHAGHVFFRFAAPFQLSDYAGALSSGQLPPPGPRMGSTGMPSLRDVRHQPGFFLRGWQGEIPPLAEILHLKLALIHGMMSAAEAAIRSRRLPLLNLKTRSFGLEWAGENSGLALWCVQPVLDHPSAATRWLSGGDGDDPVFLLAEEPPASIYRHPDITAPRFVRGNVRLSQLKAVGSQKDHLETEGTLLISEPLPRATDTVLIQCPLAAHPIQALITKLEPSRGEIVFRTSRWRPAPDIAASLASGGQAPAPMECDCAIVPRLSAPADLYALGVIALEILCGGSGQGLPMIVDEALRIAQRIGQEGISVEAVADTLAGWQRREANSNWASVLSARHLVNPALDAEAAVRMVPPIAWHATLTWCLKLLTGTWSHAWFQSPGEGSAQSPHLAFEQPLKELRHLLQRTRSLVSLEWKANLDLRDHIMAVMEK